MSDSPPSGPEPGYDIEVLGPVVVVRFPDRIETISGRAKHSFLALLASESGRHWSTDEIALKTGVMQTEAAVHTTKFRLTKYRLPLANVPGRGYVLDPAPRRVDLLDFLAAAEMSVRSRRTEDAVAALALWAGDLPGSTKEAPVFRRAVELHSHLLTIKNSPAKRVLVVEDLMGPQIADALRAAYPGDVQVDIADSVISFLAFEADLDAFDLFLVDFHLTQGDQRFQGLLHVAPRLRERDHLAPVVGMSYQARTVRSVLTECLVSDFWDLMPKKNESDGEALGSIVDLAITLLTQDESEIHRHYAGRIAQVRDLVRRDLHSRDEWEESKHRVEADVLRLEVLAKDPGKVRTLRRELRRFVDHRYSR